MKFRKFGKALLMTALSAGTVFGISSCVQSYSVGFLYVTGNETANSTGNGFITGFKIDHNTGNLRQINGLPISSGGSNPGRFVITSGQRFLYVLNQGTTTDGGPCSPTDVCSNANIVQFAIGGNGVLAPQQTYYTQGHNPFRILADTQGTHIFVLDHDAPDSVGCTLVFQQTTCGDVTVFAADPSTGRLSYVLNAQVTAASGAPLTYFPVPANPIDALLSAGNLLTLTGLSTTSAVDSVWPYTYNSANGQLTVSQNSAQPLGMTHGTAIVAASGVVYVLDNGVNTAGTNGQIFAYSQSGGALQAEANGYYVDDPTLSYPLNVLSAGSGKWLYVMNYGDNSNTTNTQSGIAGYDIFSPYQLSQITGFGGTAGTGAGPQCIVEDPSNQFIYTANFNSSDVTGYSIDQNKGNLRPLTENSHAKSDYKVPGPAAWCAVSGRTS